jgi:ATP/maltotriose-dependent transcriptional regulator MalT/DNA-binding SARP family transcriptional activator
MQTYDYILPTRIVVPRRRNDLLTRARLVDDLYDLLERKLVLLVAPAGYGKTSLLVDFAHHTEWAFCWYSLDELDREPQRFLAHFIASIQQRFPQFGERSRAVLQTLSEGDLNLDSMVSVIVNDLYEHISEHFVIVLDDYHLVDNSHGVGYFVSRIIQDTDDNCHVILASRSLISLPDLPMMVARSQVGGMGTDDLAFTPVEIQNLLLQNYHLTLSDAEAKEMARQTNGWITGLLLSTQMLSHGVDQYLSANRVTGVGLYDYLAEQVLNCQPDDLKQFLLFSSLLDEFDAAYCAEVIGEAIPMEADWGDLMDRVFRANLFVIPVGEDHIWLRYHPLFRDFLQSRVTVYYPEETEKIINRLAEAYNQRGQWERTYELWHRLGRVDALAPLVEQAGSKMIEAGRLVTLQAWLEGLPPQQVRENPRLLSLQGSVAMMRGNPAYGLDLLNRALEVLKYQPDPRLQAETLVRRSSVYRAQGDYHQSVADAQAVLELCAAKPDMDEIRAEALRMAGLAHYHRGDLATGLEMLNQSLDAYMQLKDEQSAAIVRMEIGTAHTSAGSYIAAEQSFTRALEYWRETQNFTWLANVLNNLGDLQRLMGDYEGAIATLERAVENARESGYKRMEAYALVTIGDLYGDLDASDQALSAYQEARQIVTHIQDQFLLVYLNLGESVLQRRRGNLLQSQKLMMDAHQQAEADQSPYEISLCRFAEGRLKFYSREMVEACVDLKAAKTYFEDEGYSVDALRAYLYLAVAQYHISPGAAAMQELKDVISLVTRPGKQTALLPTLRDLRSSLGQIHLDAESQPILMLLFQSVNRFDQSLSMLRRHLRRQASVVPFAPPRIYIQALGKRMVRINERVVSPSDWVTRASSDLFFYLLCRQEGVTRETVGEILWADASPGELRSRFKNTIYRLRHAVGKDVVQYQDDIYQFNTALDYEFDVEIFYKELYHAERGTDRQERIRHYVTALKQYQGPFLPDGDDQWVVVERQKVYNSYMEALLKLTTLYLEGGEYENALGICQRALAEDDCLEDAHRLAMRIYAAMGNRPAVARQYEACRAALQEEFSIPPSDKTRTLYDILMR